MNLKSLSKCEKTSLIGGQIAYLYAKMGDDRDADGDIDLKKLKKNLSRVLDLIEECGEEPKLEVVK